MGGTCFNKTMEFRLVDSATKWDHIEKVQTPAGIHEYKVGKVPAITWFTNLDHGIRHEKLILDTMANNLRFNQSLKKRLAKFDITDEYPKYDNYNAIEVPLVKCIPSDYDGVMGVPITFLGQYNPEQFEIIGADEAEGTGFSNGLFINNGHTKTQCLINNQKIYKRIFIRFKES